MKILLIFAGATHSHPLSHTLLSSLLFLPFLLPVFFFFLGQLFKQVRKSYDGNGDQGYHSDLIIPQNWLTLTHSFWKALITRK